MLAVYGMVFMGASALGQFGITLAPVGELSLLVAVSILMSISLLPLSLIKTSEPTMESYVRLRPIDLFRISPFGTSGIVFAALIDSHFWGLTPRYAHEAGFTDGQVALLMAAGVFGAGAMQSPIGRASDRLDRRAVALTPGLVSVDASVAMLFVHGSFGLSVGIIMWYGSFTLPIYAVSLAHLNDHLRQDQLVQAAAATVLLFGIAAWPLPLQRSGRAALRRSRHSSLRTESPDRRTAQALLRNGAAVQPKYRGLLGRFC